MITIDCTAAVTLFKPSFTGLGAVIHATSGHPAFKAVTAAGMGTVHETGTAPLMLPLVTVSGHAATMKIGTATIDLKAVTTGATGVVEEIAHGALSLKAMTAAGIATIHEIAHGALTLKKPIVSGIASVFEFPGIEINEPELAQGPYVHRESQFTIVHSDRERLLICISAVPVSVTLPAATGAFGRGFRTQVLNLGAGVVTITAAAGMINELSDPIVLVTTDNVELWSDGANWYAVESNYS